MAKLLGYEKAAEQAMMQMKNSPYNYKDTRWAAYQNHDMNSGHFGHLQFLAVGPQNTFKEPPARMPDTDVGLGWRYLFVGWVDLNTGEVCEAA